MHLLNPLDRWADRIIAAWTLSGVQLQQGVSVARIAALERQLNFDLPEDFKALYLRANGFKEGAWEKNMFSLWPVELILKEFKEGLNSNYIGFCDYLVYCHTIGFSRLDGNVYKYHNEPERITGSFQNFIAMLFADDTMLY